MDNFMNDLIWVGNTLLPRGLVILTAIGFAIILIGLFVMITDDK